MDDNGREIRRQWMDYCRGIPPQHQVNEQYAFLKMLLDERDAAVEERDKALAEKKAAMEEWDMAIRQRDAAIAERDNAIRERDNAIAALQFQEKNMSAAIGYKICRTKRSKPQSDCVTDAVPVSAFPSESAKSRKRERVKPTKGHKSNSTKPAEPSRKTRKVSDDSSRRFTTVGSKAEWDTKNRGSINPISFDESTMPVPVCTCTGTPRQCYKWGHGGWQSSCCTTSLSEYPLPFLPHRRRGRIAGRKMSGSVYSRLLSSLSARGYDLSTPLDLKNYWAKHGTNRYVTIK